MIINLNQGFDREKFEKYKQLGLTEMVEWESEHGKNKHKKEKLNVIQKIFKLWEEKI